MKSIFLLRHAKSSWSEPGQDDQQRPLNKRGQRDAPEMAARFKLKGETLDLIVTSPALRARQTAQLFADACASAPVKIIEESQLYLSGCSAIEDIIENQDDRCQSLMLVFHNPDITNAVNIVNTDNYIGNVPTCGLIKLSCDIQYWSDWSWSKTQFEYFDYPKKTQAD